MEYPQRKQHRLSTWDYSQNGYYHVTICTRNRRKILCEIYQSGAEAVVAPTAVGEIVIRHWNQLPEIYPEVKTDFFCLMPNHIHGILIIEHPPERAGRTLSSVIRGFKSVVTRAFNEMAPETERNQLWQPSFYDEIIRNDEMLFDIRKYILGNPSKWLEDPLFTK